MFDLNGDGFISASEFRAVMKSLGNDITSEEVDDIIKHGDINGDGLIDYEG